MRSCWKTWGALAVAAIALTGCSPTAGMQGADGPSKAAVRETQKQFPAFHAKDLSGKDVTSDIFARKKITVINIWGTFCPPCIGEMPELGEWARNMPKDAQLIGIVCDISGEDDKKTIGEAQRILGDAHADFVNLLPNKEIGQYLENVEAVPTTIFVDSQGKILGDPVLGANVPQYQKIVSDYLHE